MTWIVNSNGGEDVSHYAVVLSENLNFTKIAYSEKLSVIDNSDLTQEGGTVTVHVPCLAEGTTYYAKVEASNSVGTTASAIQSCSTPRGQSICYYWRVLICCLVLHALCCLFL